MKELAAPNLLDGNTNKVRNFGCNTLSFMCGFGGTRKRNKRMPSSIAQSETYFVRICNNIVLGIMTNTSYRTNIDNIAKSKQLPTI